MDGQITSTGEGLSGVKVIPYSDIGTEADANSLNQFWLGDDDGSRVKIETCIWVKGMWYWITNIQKRFGSGQDVLNEVDGLYCGRVIGTGLQTGGTGGKTDIEATPKGVKSWQSIDS